MADFLTDFNNNLNKNKNILLIIPTQPSVDSVAASLAFYLCLQGNGKQVTVACPQPITVGLNRLVAVDKIISQIGSRNLVASFDYVEDSIEKVSYHISDGKFNLVIQPKTGFPPLDAQKVSYSYTGLTADFIIIIGAQKLENLGRIYQDEQKIFIDYETANIDINPANSLFGKINLIDQDSSSCSELIGLIIKTLNLTINADVATNILAGIEQATNNFVTKTRAETFEVVAWCLKNGGRRWQMQTKPVTQPFDVRPFMNNGTRQKRGGGANVNSSTSFPQNNKQPGFPKQQPPSPDWLKPKIYKSSGQV
jgi:hypothetical protein